LHFHRCLHCDLAMNTNPLYFTSYYSVLVELIDSGTEVFTTPANLRPLLKKFGRIPPMALRCRVKGSINDLNTEKIEAFRKIVVDCRGVVRVELLTTCESGVRLDGENEYYYESLHPNSREGVPFLEIL
uniref:Tudor domain-containing protein n=1 Tax=Heligmosomoides polygyrus TaxID=6339 RepID=A0A183F5E5_HELPZ